MQAKRSEKNVMDLFIQSYLKAGKRYVDVKESLSFCTEYSPSSLDALIHGNEGSRQENQSIQTLCLSESTRDCHN